MTRKPRLVAIGNRNYTEHVLDCVDCGSPMHLVKSYFGVKYLCTKDRCYGTVDAYSDGEPISQQIDRATKRAREEAQDLYDRLTSIGVSNSAAVEWLQKAHGNSLMFV